MSDTDTDTTQRTQQPFAPQVDPPEVQWYGEDYVPPVPTVYVARTVKTHELPSDRFATATYVLDNVTAQRIKNRSESGIASRVTLTMFSGGGHVAIANGREGLQGVVAGIATLGTVAPNAFILPAPAAGVLAPFQVATTEEIWAIALTANAVSVAWLSVLEEQFYGIDKNEA